MKAKVLTLSVLSMFIVAMLAVFVSASSLNIPASTVMGDIQTVNDVTGTAVITFDLTNSGANSTGNLWIGTAATVSGGSATVSFDVSSIVNGASVPVIATITFSNSDLGSGITGTITANGNGGNEVDTILPFTITITDTTAPVITLTGNTVVNVEIGTTYTDEGATALDNVDGVLTVVVANPVDTAVLGSYIVTYDVKDSSGNDATQVTRTVNVVPISLPLEITACSELGNPGELRVKDIDFNNLGILILKESSGDIYLEFGDDDEWFPLDEIEVEIEIENNGDFDIDDIEVIWGIYDTNSNKLIIEFDDEKDFNLKDGKDEIITISFQLEDDLDIDLDDLDDGKHYRFYVIATGTIDDSKAGDLDGDETCASGSDNAEIVIENDFVVLTDVQYPETVQCGENVQISAKVWNIGDDDQDEVKVEVHNNDLGLFHRTVEIGDIDAFDDDVYNFNFRVPNDAEEKTHSLSFQVLDEDFDVYENDFDDDDSEFTLPLRVSGGCNVEKSGVSISANIESGGKAGEQLVVKTTITNNGDELNTFTVNVAGFTQWASSYTADRTSLVLGAGDSVDVLLTFDVNKDASGSQSFTIELVSEDNQVTTQPVSVAIEGKRSGLFGITGAVITSENAYLWGIAILNIILVLVIIIVAVRVLKK